MSLNILVQPTTKLLSAGNDNYTTLSGDTFGAANVFEYKYIADVYVNGVLSVTLKSFPDPVYGIGIFNLRNVVDKFIGTDFFPTETTPPTMFHTCPNSSVRVFMQFGEEYLSGNTFIKSTSLVSGSTAVYINGSLSFIDQKQTDFGQYIANPSGTSMKLLDKRAIQTIQSTTTGLIYNSFTSQRKFIYYVNDLTATPQLRSNLFTVTTRRGTSTIGIYTINNPLWLSGCTDVMAIEIGYNQIAAMPTSGYTVNLGPASITGNGEDNMLIHLFGSGVVGITQVSWIFIQNKFIDNCGRTADTAYTLYWLNEFGGFNSFLFNKKTETSQNKQQQLSKKPYGTLSSNGQFTINTYDRNQQAFYTVLQDSIVINSELLVDIDVLYLKSLFNSPIIYMEDQSGTIISVTVDQDNYRISRKVNQKIFSLELTVKPSYNDFRQNI